jgi:squalene-hopene/tetraprenyl-beta-curcumene cyclase
MIASADRVVGESSEKASSPRERLCEQAIIRAVRFLTTAVESDQHREPWPIGFYFAKLWYHERLYPLVLTLAALGLALRWLSAQRPSRGVPDSGDSSPDTAAP